MAKTTLLAFFRYLVKETRNHLFRYDILKLQLYVCNWKTTLLYFSNVNDHIVYRAISSLLCIKIQSTSWVMLRLFCKQSRQLFLIKCLGFWIEIFNQSVICKLYKTKFIDSTYSTRPHIALDAIVKMHLLLCEPKFKEDVVTLIINRVYSCKLLLILSRRIW